MKQLQNIPLLKLVSLILILFNLKLLLTIPFLLKKRIFISYNSEKFKIQALLFFIIVYIVSCDFILQQVTYLTIKNISPFSLAFFFSFVRVDMKFLVSLKKVIYIIFFIDFSSNILSIFLNLNVRLNPVNYFDSYYHSLIGIFGHPYLSVTLSCVTFLYATLFNERRMQIFALSALFVGSSHRSLLFFYPISLVYVFLAKRIKPTLILVALLFGIFSIFQFVKYDSNLEQYKRCDLYIQTNQYVNCKDLNSSALRYYAWTNFFSSKLSFFPEERNIKREGEYSHLSLDVIKNDRISESPYLQAATDYGLPLPFLYLLLFLFWFYKNHKNYIKIRRNSFSKNLYASKLVIISLFFFDSFYGTFFFCVITSLTVFFILFYEPKKATS